MTLSATQMSHAEIARIDEANELRLFVIQYGETADRVRRRMPDAGKTRMHMGFVLDDGAGVTAVAVGATEMHDPRLSRVARVVRIV